MSHPVQRRPVVWIVTVLFLSVADLPAKAQSKRPVTVADTITMTQLIDEGTGLQDFLQWSPDGEHFSVVIERGDVDANERIFSLLVFRAAAVFDQPAEIVAVMRSSSNDDAISDVRWLDNDTVTFLGVDGRTPSQVYAVNVQNKQLRQLTKHRMKINAYAVAPRLRRVIYTADADLTIENDELRRNGFTVTDQSLTDILMGNLVSGRLAWRDLDYEVPQETFIKEMRSGAIARVSSSEATVVIPNSLFPYSKNPVSPDGRFAVLQGLIHGRKDWQSFKTPFPSTVAGSSDMAGFVLVDLESGAASPLIDSPSSPYLTSVAWAPDNRSIVLVNTFLPLPAKVDASGNLSVQQTFVAEVDLASRSVTAIHGPALDASTAQGVVCAQAIDWRSADILRLAISRTPDSRGGTCGVDEVVAYQKNPSGWRELNVSTLDSGLRSTPDGRITISVDEGLNTPPNLKAFDHGKGLSKVFTDFNPQLRELRLAHVNLISWTASDGAKWSGDLYLPPDAKPGTRYPLVIQTHGCTPDRFDMTGFGPDGATGYAAQVLAGKGIVVLQEGHCTDAEKTSHSVQAPYYSARNAEHELLGYESAIDFLDRQGLIDRNRVGLQGHSATAWIVIYAAAHPKIGYHYAAILSTARGDLGYFAYLATSYGRFWSLQGNGSEPVGENFETFRRNALPFNLVHVSAPIMSQEPDGVRYLPLIWEVHEVLQMLGKPEELIVFPDGVHNLVKPSERLTSQEAAVDWFSFWLLGEQDLDPGKQEQYARWRAMLQKEEASVSQ